MAEEAEELAMPLRAKSVMTKIAAVAQNASVVTLDYRMLKEHWYDRIRVDDRLKDSLREDFSSESFDFMVYLRMSVNNTTSHTFDFGVPVWAMICLVFWVHLALHLWAHIAYVRIMTTYLCITTVVLVGMFLMIQKYHGEVRREVYHDQEEQEELG